MKRALIVLLLLAVAGGLFAQVTFGGNGQSGVEVVIPKEGDTTFHWYSADAGLPYRFQLNATYNNDSGQAGAYGSIRVNNGAFAANGVNAWVEPIDNVLRLQAGTGGPGGFGSLGSFGEGHNANDISGLNIRFAPVLSGSTFSVGAGIGPNNLAFGKATYAFGVAFGLPSLINAAANLRYNGNSEVTDVAAGIGVLALNAASSDTGLSRLAIDVVAKDITNLGWIGIGPAVGFRVAGVGAGALSTTLQARVFVPLKDEYDLDYWVGLDLGVPFTSAVSFNLNAGYEGNSGALPAVGDYGLSASNGEGTGRAIGGTGNAGIFVRPQVTFNIGGGSLVTGWSLQTLLADEMEMQHAIYAYFSVGF